MTAHHIPMWLMSSVAGIEKGQTVVAKVLGHGQVAELSTILEE